MPSGGNHYTQWILELYGLEYSKMHRNDCYQTLQGFEVFPLDYNGEMTHRKQQKVVNGDITLEGR